MLFDSVTCTLSKITEIALNPTTLLNWFWVLDSEEKLIIEMDFSWLINSSLFVFLSRTLGILLTVECVYFAQNLEKCTLPAFEFIENMWKKRSVVKEQCFDSTNKWTLWSSRVTQLTGFNYHFQQCWGKIHFKSNRISNLKSISCKSNESVRQKTWLLSSFIYLYKLKIIINCWNWKTCGSNDISTMELQTIWKLGVKETNEFSCQLANLIYVFYRL